MWVGSAGPCQWTEVYLSLSQTTPFKRQFYVIFTVSILICVSCKAKNSYNKHHLLIYLTWMVNWPRPFPLKVFPCLHVIWLSLSSPITSVHFFFGVISLLRFPSTHMFSLTSFTVILSEYQIADTTEQNDIVVQYAVRIVSMFVFYPTTKTMKFTIVSHLIRTQTRVSTSNQKQKYLLLYPPPLLQWVFSCTSEKSDGKGVTRLK